MKKHFCFRKIIAFFCFLIITLSSLSCLTAYGTGVRPAFPDTTGAATVYLYNYESDKVIYSKGLENKKISPASTVKIMSGLLAIRYLENRLEENVTITQGMLRGVEGSTVHLKEGDTLKIKDLLYGLICGGGNDAAIALANICCQSVETFVSEMNNAAKEYGMTDTAYTNPTGIDDTKMTTSLNDTVILSKEAVKNKLFMEISSAKSYTYSPIGSIETKTIYNRNALISTFTASGYQNKSVKGLNAGITDRGGYCLSAYATDGQDSYLCIVMGAAVNSSNKIMSYEIANDLLSYVFDNYTYTQIAKKGDVISKLTVDLALPTNGNDSVYAECILENDIYAFAPKNIDYKNDLTYRSYYHAAPLTAPVQEGIIVGGTDIYYNGEYIASARLLTNKSITESKLLKALDNMKSFMLSRKTILFLIIITPLILLYLYIAVWKSKIKKKKALRRHSKRLVYDSRTTSPIHNQNKRS